jgi:prepilin-type processing-associated H-X9-DG protein
MQTNPDSRPSRAAFTRADLLALLAVVALLGALALPLWAKPAQRTLVVQCAANLRQFSMATHLYAMEHRDLLPAVSSGTLGSWAWDMPKNLADALESRANGRGNFYCPSVLADVEPRGADAWWGFGGSSFAVLGYAHTFSTGSTVLATNLNPSINPQPIQAGGVSHPAPSPSRRVMLADPTLSNSGNVVDRTANAYSMSGGIGQHSSAHMEGRLPAGGNVAMLDGSVVWRPFAEMRPQTGGGPYFWW